MTDFTRQMDALRLRFVARAEDERQALSAAADREDMVEMQRISHRLAGIAAIFGYERIGALAMELEDALDARLPQAEVRSLRKKLCRELEDVGKRS